MSQRALADALGHTEPAVSAMMRELVERGAVTLEAVDGRERRVVITEEGRRIVAAVRAMTGPMFDAAMASAGVDSEVLGDQLQRLAAGLGVGR
ncbi:winged helix-turn-helix transcriptional regulator [Agromyces sp. SYSU K20354]|uniref:winged helix-turn-helix transcriptional regulator n=1 Tax=Agromyces cavernae TaxID=2898659 RepID=UPI001E33D84D|nr:winged helix-turn-helix transcriptional regulator [Agromyces cavernae]MCD2442019.1 winged helix-turn-helix transcriptional regulator [Agromyces cavernae]